MVLEWLGNGWKVHSAFPYKFGHIPSGFCSDGLTLKFRIVHAIIDRAGPGLKGAIIHDFMLVNGVISKKVADRTFYEQILEDGMHPVRAWLAYQAVKLFSYGNFSKPAKT